MVHGLWPLKATLKLLEAALQMAALPLIVAVGVPLTTTTAVPTPEPVQVALVTLEME